MRHVRMLGLCLVAVLAVAAVAATSAMALPEWGKCEAKTGGKYTESNCQTKAKKGAGSFEFIKGKALKNVPFSGSNVGSGGVLTTSLVECSVSEEGGGSRRIPRPQCEAEGGKAEAVLAVAIECESEHNTGEATGAKGVTNVSVLFRGCKIFGSAPCSNGPEEGEIRVNPLKGELGYINKAEHKVGLLLEPKTKKGEFAKFTCAGVLSSVVGEGNVKEGAAYSPESHGGYDQIISPITPVNQTTSTYEQVYTVNPETYENIPSKFEGKHISLLESYTFNAEEPKYSTMWAPSGEAITNVNTASEEGMIKA